MPSQPPPSSPQSSSPPPSAAAPLQVSFCTTCKGRLHHLRETLPANLRAEEESANVEFVVLDYDSADGLGDWVQGTFAAEIASGRVVYARHAPAPHFRMAHAKNMAHRVASGDILVNLDSDNLLAPGTAAWLRAEAARRPRFLASPRDVTAWGFLRQRYLNRFTGARRPTDGLCGRIAVSAEVFRAVGGYDEAIAGWGADDIDFTLRARDAGAALAVMPTALWGGTIEHTNEARLENLAKEDLAASGDRLGRSTLATLGSRLRQILSTHDSSRTARAPFGCGTVTINGTRTVELTAGHGAGGTA